jgi:hypothetical protein
MRPNEPNPPLRRVDRDELPIWLPDERVARESFELVRDNWWAVKQRAGGHETTSPTLTAPRRAA